MCSMDPDVYEKVRRKHESHEWEGAQRRVNIPMDIHLPRCKHQRQRLRQHYLDRYGVDITGE